MPPKNEKALNEIDISIKAVCMLRASIKILSVTNTLAYFVPTVPVNKKKFHKIET
jgi:hypothetical protein